MEMPATTQVAPRTWKFAFRTLSIQNFRIFFIGQAISLLGTWSQMIALSWLVWRLTESAWWLGAVGFATQVPILFLGLIGGFVADRYSRLPLLLLTQFLCMLQAIVLSILVFLGMVEVWHIMVLSLTLGVIYAFEFPLRQAFIMDMVGRNDLLNAIALNATMIHSTRIIGPVIAGVIIGWWGEATCFGVNAVSFLFLIFALIIIDRTKLIEQEKNSEGIKKAITEGLKYIWHRPNVKAVLILITFISGFGMIYVALMPLFVGKIYGKSALELGWLMGASGVGALMGALYLARRTNAHGLFSIIIRYAIGYSLLVLIFAFVRNQYSAMFVLLLAGFCLAIILSSANTFLQYEVPNRLRGRMMSLFVITFFGLSPLGYIMGGAIAEKIGAPITVGTSGFICLIISLIVLLVFRKEVGRKAA